MRSMIAGLFLLSAIAVGQDVHIAPAKGAEITTAPVPQRVIELGMDRDSVRAILGEPERYYGPSLHAYIPTENYSKAMAMLDGNVEDVFTRRSEIGEYEVRVNYRPDASKSRLHPRSRVIAIEIELDKPAMRNEVLTSIPEIATRCKSSCRLTGLVDLARLIATPANPTIDDYELGAGVSTWWGSADKSQFLPAMTFVFDRTSGRVLQVEFGSADLGDVARQQRVGSPAPVDYGTWKTP